MSRALRMLQRKQTEDDTVLPHGGVVFGLGGHFIRSIAAPPSKEEIEYEPIESDLMIIKYKEKIRQIEILRRARAKRIKK